MNFISTDFEQNSRKGEVLKKPLFTLLYPKKLLAFLAVFSLFLPFFAEAGFFSNLIKFLTTDTGDVIKETQASTFSIPLLSSQPTPDMSEDSGISAGITQNSSLVSPLNPLGTLSNSANRDKVIVYKVQEGDTPSSIAKSFGISLNTLLWANNLRSPNLISIGDDLVILPVSGVKYEVKKGDTIEAIAKKLKGDTNEILEFNGLAIDETLVPGQEIIVPDGESPSASVASPGSIVKKLASLPEFIGYYLRPILGGRNSRATRSNPHGLHGNNGVDLATSCGSPVLASAGGAVIAAKNYSKDVRFGYGNYVVIDHPNGTQTLYGHLSRLLVDDGQAVEQGYAIGLVGSSGNSTGCHVHFEIRGARNPF